MKNWKKILIVGGTLSCMWTLPALASTNLETGSSLAGISVALNNYYAGNEEPEKKLADHYGQMESRAEAEAGSAGGSGGSAGSSGAAAGGSGSSGAAAETAGGNGAAGSGAAKSSPYDNIAVSKVNGSVNIRAEANTGSTVQGKIYNDCAATILDTVDGEDGKWYKIKSGSVTGYIKSEYFVTGSEAEAKAKTVGNVYGTVVDTPSLRLRENPDLTSKTLTLLAEGAHYSVVGQEGDFLKVAVDTDLEGYVFKDYMKTDVQFKEAVSLEEEKAKEEEEAKLKADADKAIADLEKAKADAAAKKTTAAAKTEKAETKKAETTAAPETTKTTTAGVQVIAANPESGKTATVEAPEATRAPETTKAAAAPTEKPAETKKGPSAEQNASSEVASATRNAVVAYAKQFLGNPYVYGGTSLTNGSDCSGFVMSVFSHFGISTGRSSRDQAARGREIDVSAVQPGDLLFYASGNYINHVGIYVGGGQIIHSSTPATGICYAPSNYRTPCKAVTFFD